MKNRNNFTMSQMFCTKCGKQNFDIPRIIGQQRESGHLKKLYCIYCKEVTNNAEIRSSGSYTERDFREEFELGRFVDGQRVPISELLSCKNVKCKYNKDGKCWNVLHSKECEDRKITLKAKIERR